MREDYNIWLSQQGYADNTCVAQLHRVQKVEQHYGSLDDLLRNGQFDKVVEQMQYSTADERADRPNPSQITFNGNIRNNLQSYKNATLRYARFWHDVVNAGVPFLTSNDAPAVEVAQSVAMDLLDTQPEKQRFALEKDMQAALRRDITALESGLSVIDDGAEYSVSSGFIDVLCENAAGDLVVVELKAGKTDARVVGQVLGYMGDLLEDYPERNVRGIIVAHEFDRRTESAAKAVPNLDLVRYAISFTFERATTA